MREEDIHSVISLLRKETAKWEAPIVGRISSKDPFRVLISTLLSSRTKDDITEKACNRLFAKADTPEKMYKLTETEIARLIYPVGFYKTKAKNIKSLCKQLLEKFGGKVPSKMESLLTLKGVGRKTASLVITLGFQKQGICVDTHVHRISNRLGLIKTKNPIETEKLLKAKLPSRYWRQYNKLMVSFGQHICRPLSPFCSKCVIRTYCDRVGVKKSR